MNLPLKQLKFSSLFHNVGPEAFLLGPGVHKNKIYSFSRNHTSGHLKIEYTTLNKAFLKLHENERMLSLAACSSASISFSKVDKTLRFEARLINQLKICEGSFIRSLDFLLLFYQEKSKKKKGVI